MKTVLTTIAAMMAAIFVTASAQAQQAALTGKVTSAEEGAMEGVLISAKKDGGNITVTVVSNDKGQYAFPTSKLSAGHYALSIRATGYDLDGPKDATVAAGKGTTADVKLKKTRNMANQMSNVEWLVSMPGTDKQKKMLSSCVGCHTVQRIVSSNHTPEEFVQIFKRMGTYSPGSTPTHPQPLLPGPRGERAPIAANLMKSTSEFLASVNLSEQQTWEWPLKALPRPKGRATHVIYTEYDLPRPEAQPHDVIVAADGMVWFSDFGSQFVGKLDPKTGKEKDYPVPVLKDDEPRGLLEVESAPDGTIWASMMYQGGIVKVDPKTGKVTAYPVPKDWQTNSTQESMVFPNYSNVDGYVWTNNQETHKIYRVNVKTGKYEDMGVMKDASGKQISAYGMPADQKNGLYLLEFGGTSIGHFDQSTKTVNIYKTPSAGSKPRRGRVDDQGRLWFAEYGNNAVGMFDPKTKAIKEWQLPTPFSDPYDAVAAKNGDVWTGSMLSDQVDRLDTKTGTFTEYLLPRKTNIRRVFYDNTGNALWVGSNHGGSIIKVETLD
jgi:streptogramin lyase